MKVKKILMVMSLVFVILLVIITSFVVMQNITGAAVIDKYSYTKAICDSDNYCEDYEIICEGEETLSISPTGFSVQHSLDWEDPRDAQIINKIC